MSNEPSGAGAPASTPTGATPASPDGPLIPGASIAEGRYRLLMFHGGPPNLQFWQALDTALDRQVALTFVDPDHTLPRDTVAQVLAATSRLSRFDRPGIARVLDVADTDSGGLVVSEWIRGGSLQEVAATAPSPIGGTRAVQALAAAAEQAHQAGLALSLDHPSRIRVSIDGDVALAFPATLPGATPEEDVRGIGAALYALLINSWPLPEAGHPSGLPPAAVDPTGQPVEPRSVNPAIPFQISAAAVHATQVDGGIRTAPTLLNLLQQATAVADRTASLQPVDPGPDRRVDPPPPAEPADEAEQARRKRRLVIGAAVAGVTVLLVLVMLYSLLSRIFGLGGVGDGIDGDQLGLNPSTTIAENPRGVVKPVRATVFSPQGEADAPGLAELAIDSSPATMWPTDTYSDPDPFPGFKNGVGLMLQLAQPTKLESVDIGITSTGTKIQIRSATDPDPGSLEDTVALTEPTAVRPGTNTIKVDSDTATSHVLVWISTLGTVDGKSRTDITDITLHAAS